jgi:hypothetical protein
MRQTVKYARVRAIQDPDRTKDNGGTHYGSNAVGSFRLDMDSWLSLFFATRTTRGAHVRAGE